ncbi:hypothetical protein OH76DRAFT_1407939 [Lentinus brumalis]|uniref:Uncharacterized protein n=1 Tax=Lentinus brumalis TaxID=2498619 RepID=A0A371CZ60_9APHY|nr:hypothetical protein OH76DRAFT_1407939 [Polyporus brumalis]
MLAAPSPVAPSPPRLPPADHRITIPERPSLASRRRSTNSLSPLHGSRPHRSSPLAGPSIAFSHDGTLKATSAPPTPSGGRHLSPLAEFSTTAAQVEEPGDEADSKKRRRRSIGAVLSKISFPSSGSSSSSSGPEPTSPQRESPVRPRQRSRSASSRTAPPVPAVPPLPAWAHNTLPSPSMSPHKLPSSSSRTHPHSPGSSGSSKSSSSPPSSPTPSARSTTSRRTSVINTPGGSPGSVSARTTPSTSRNPEENWLTQSAAPRFSRLGLKAEGVVLPVSAREARRRSTVSTLSVASTSRVKSVETLSAHSRASTVGHAPSSRMSVASTSTFTPSSLSHSHSQTHSTAHSSRHRSRTSSFASASSGRASVDCDTPSLTMSPGPSASDVSLAAPEVDELGVLTRRVQLQLNDVPVGVIGVPEEAEEDSVYPAIRDKGKGRARDYDEYGLQIPPVRAGADSTASSIASVGSIGSLVSERSAFTVPWTRSETSRPGSPRSERSSYFGSAVELPRSHERAATAPAAPAEKGVKTEKEKERRSRTGTIGRMWRQVVRSVSARR